MGAPKDKRKKTAFVPRIVFEVAAVASVVPLCAACSGGVVQQAPEDGSADVELLGVALVMSDAGLLPLTVAAMVGDASNYDGVAVSCFGNPACAPIEAGVADGGFVLDGSVADASFAVADASFRDVQFLGVAAFGFDADKG